MLVKDTTNSEQTIPEAFIIINVFFLFAHNKDESKGVQFTVLNDRSQGGASLLDGSVELMVKLYDTHTSNVTVIIQ